jgi:tRNA threonylcarbamoyladenosine biosynthesis protein TsaB
MYRQVPGGVQRLAPYQVGTPEDLASELLARGEDCLVVGDGAIRYPEILTEVSGAEAGDATSAFPSAASLVELAHPQALREEFVQPWELEPLYLRKSDAEINWTAAMERSS